MSRTVADPAAALHPAQLALTFVGYQSGDDATLDLHRSRSRFVRRWTVYAAAAAAVLVVVPTIVVLTRREPAYLTDFVLILAGVLVVLIVGGGALGSWLWSRSARGRAQLDRAVLVLSPSSLTIPGSPDVVADWSEVVAVRTFGRRSVSLAVDLAPPRVTDLATTEEEEPDEAAPTDPVDQTGYDETGYDETEYVEPEGGHPDHDNEADVSATILDPPPPQVSAPPAPPPPAGDHWNEQLYGTRHVIDVRGTSPSLTTVSETMAALTHGRLFLR